MMRLAERKKTAVRQTIEDMREAFRGLRDRNRALPPRARLFKKVRPPTSYDHWPNVQRIDDL